MAQHTHTMWFAKTNQLRKHLHIGDTERKCSTASIKSKQNQSEKNQNEKQIHMLMYRRRKKAHTAQRRKKKGENSSRNHKRQLDYENLIKSHCIIRNCMGAHTHSGNEKNRFRCHRRCCEFKIRKISGETFG